MNPADTSLRAQPTEPAAFSFQLSPEPPPVSARDALAVAPGRDQAVLLDDAIDSAWFAEPREAAEDDVGSDALANALSDAPTQTPPPARALPMPARPLPARAVLQAPVDPVAELPPAQGRAPTLPRPITIDDPLTDPPLPLTPTWGHQLSELLTAPSEEPAPVIRALDPAPVSDQLPQTKALSFPADARQAAVAERPLTPTAPRKAEPSPEPDPEPARERAQLRREPAKAAEPESGSVEAAAAPAAAPTVKDTSTFKVIGYALVAMAFSYIGMSALVAWLSDSNATQPGTAPVATTAQAALTDVEASAEVPASAEAPEGAEATEAPSPAAPPGAAAEAPAAAPAKGAQAAEQVAIEDLPVPAGLALGADKGVLKLVTPDAHTLYVDGEFAGRGPVRIVPLAPGKHTVKTRFDGEEKSYDANVQAGRMTRLTISAAK